MFKSMKDFAANESGATAIEYALIASLIAVFIHGGPNGRHEDQHGVHRNRQQPQVVFL
jgi:hypothetical protein